MAVLALLIGCGSADPGAAPAAAPLPSGSDIVDTTPGDSLRLSLAVPAEAAAGVPVPVTLAIENVSGAPLDLYLRGRTIAFDIIVSRAAGDTVWQRLAGEVIPGILRLESLAPAQVLELSDEWDQRDNAGSLVEPGDYSVHAEVLTEGAPLRSPAAALRIVR
jgi:hypothetical protein